MNKEYATFDKNGVYEQEIAPLITELKRISSENRIPFFAAFGTMMENGKFDRGAGIRSTAVIPEVLGLASQDSFFPEFINVVNGAKTYYDVQKEAAPELVDPLEKFSEDGQA